MTSYIRSHLKQLESEAIFVMREVAAQFERPVLLFSGGKDSIVMVHLARRAFHPGKIPFPLMHVDTGHNFPETLEFRDWLVEEVGARLIVRYVQDSIDQGRVVEETGPTATRNALQTVTLLDGLTEFKFDAALGGARREAAAAFGNGDLLLERAVLRPRHVEVQVFGDRHGRVLHLGERECSVQRRHQKVIEESPSPAVSPALRAEMGAAAVALAAAVGYAGAGTVEFLLDEAGRFTFLEMNTRLQVEHPVTELVTGIDLVEWQLRVAAGEALPWAQADIALTGHAIEARLYAEDPAADFRPTGGEVLLWQPPTGEGVRVDDGIATGSVVGGHYDPLLAKISAAGPTRADALRRLNRALADTVLFGLTTNLAYLRAIVAHPDFVVPDALSTRFLAEALPDWRPARDPEETAAALIAVALAQWQQQTAGGPGYWRNNPGQPPPLRYRVGDETAEVYLRPVPWQAGQFTVALSPDDMPRAVEQADSLRYGIDGLWRHVVLATKGDEWWVQTADGPLRLTALPLLPEPQRAGAAGNSLRAPLPGTVLAVLVDVGQTVAEGEPLVKLEAMKMEYTIRAAAAGMVAAIHHAPGDSVAADALLVTIESARA